MRLRRGFSGCEHLIDEGALIVRKTDVAFPVGDANEKRGDRDVVGVRRREFQRADADELRVGTKRFERIDAPANFGLDGRAGIRIGIGGKRNEQNAQRASRVERHNVGCVAEQSDAAVGDALRVLGKFRQAECFR